MNFWKNPLEREEYKVRAKSLVRTMSCVSTNDGNVVNCSGSESQSIADNSEFAQREILPAEPPLKRRKFSLKDHIAPMRYETDNVDEISSHKSTSINQFGLNQDKFLTDSFSIFNF